jgi:hypothetical protein
LPAPCHSALGVVPAAAGDRLRGARDRDRQAGHPQAPRAAAAFVDEHNIGSSLLVREIAADPSRVRREWSSRAGPRCATHTSSASSSGQWIPSATRSVGLDMSPF